VLTAESVRQILNYDPETGEFVWLISPNGNGRGRVVAGDRARHIAQNGYHLIRYRGQIYRAHRLAWLYVYGVWPTQEIDHINGDRADNRIANLRQATSAENHANAGRRKGNRSGIKGVSWYKPTRKWRARIVVDYREIYLGYFDTAEAAQAAYLAAAKEHFGAFARAA